MNERPTWQSLCQLSYPTSDQMKHIDDWLANPFHCHVCKTSSSICCHDDSSPNCKTGCCLRGARVNSEQVKSALYSISSSTANVTMRPCVVVVPNASSGSWVSVWGDGAKLITVLNSVLFVERAFPIITLWEYLSEDWVQIWSRVNIDPG